MKNYINSILDNLEELRHVDGLIRTQVGDRVMYKVNLGTTLDPISTLTPSIDYSYEFIIDFDPHNYGYGVRYGVRCIVTGQDWESITHTVGKQTEEFLYNDVLLHNSFVDQKYSIERILNLAFMRKISHKIKPVILTPFDSCSCWAFWIRLREDQDINIAAHSIKLIANYYLVTLTGSRLTVGGYQADLDSQLEQVKTDLYYTTSSLSKLAKSLGNDWPTFKKFLKTSIEKGYLVRDRYLELSWRLTRGSGMKFITDYINLMTELKLCHGVIPWKFIELISSTQYKQVYKYLRSKSK